MKHVKIGVILVCMAMAACTAKSPESSETEHPVIGITWFLTEIKTPDTEIALERPTLNASGRGEAYTLRFESESQISGIAAMNSYSAPCSWGEDFTLSIGHPSATRLETTRELALKEADFFWLLERVNRWNLTDDGRLELHTPADENGHWAILVFGQK